MTGIDTNVLTRFIMQDDRQQFMAASAFMSSLTPESPGFIGLVTVAEICWILMRRYRLSRSQFSLAMERLLNSTLLQFENQNLVAEALLLFDKTNADFADCLVSLSAKASGCDDVVTFDIRSSKVLAMTLLK
jgi:predicted nucleic-acid-binding protein